MDDAEPRQTEERPRPLYQRLLALAALLALLASGAWSSWAILTDRADFGAPAPASREAAEEGPVLPGAPG